MRVVLKESLWLLHLPHHCHCATYEGGDAIDVCGADRGSLTARGKVHHFMQETRMCNTYDLATGILVE